MLFLRKKYGAELDSIKMRHHNDPCCLINLEHLQTLLSNFIPHIFANFFALDVAHQVMPFYLAMSPCQVSKKYLKHIKNVVHVMYTSLLTHMAPKFCSNYLSKSAL